MSKTFLIHVTWFVVAAAAFAFGRVILPPSGDGGPEGVANLDLNTNGGPGSDRENAKSKSRRAKAGVAGSKEGVSPGSVKSAGGAVSIAAYLNETDPLQANAMFANLLLELTPENAREMFEALKESNTGGREGGQQMGLFLEAWGRQDGAAAIEAVGELGGDGRRRAFASMSAITGWASSDPKAAMEYVATAEGGWEKNMMEQGLVSGLARTDPNAATEYVLAQEAARKANGEGEGEGGRDDRWRGFAADRQMETIANVLMRQGLSTATSWAEGLPAGELKASAFDRVAERYVRDDPAAAARWVEGHADQEYAGRAVREVAEEFARSDPKAAMDWAANLPDQSQRDAYSETLQRWTRDDAQAASSYLDQMAESPARDAAVSSFARELDRSDPSSAATWASTIADQEVRVSTLESVARSWMGTNPEAATTWLSTSGLPAESQQQILNQSQRRQGDGRRDRGR